MLLVKPLMNLAACADQVLGHCTAQVCHDLVPVVCAGWAATGRGCNVHMNPKPYSYMRCKLPRRCSTI